MSETRSVNRDSFLSMHVFVVIKRRRASCKERVVGCRCYTLRALALTHTQPPPVHRGQCPGTGSVSCPPQQFELFVFGRNSKVDCPDLFLLLFSL